MLLYGINPVQAALETGRRTLHELLLKPDPHSERLERIREAARTASVPVRELQSTELAHRCGSPAHQGAVLRCGALPVDGEQAALALAAEHQSLPPEQAPLLVALDEVEDPRNLGAVVRSCAAFGAAGVVLLRRHSAPLGAAASSASAGALESFPVYEAANMARFLENARKAGFWVAGTTIEKGEPLAGFQRSGPLVLVLGNEGRGIRDLVSRNCDYHLTIPLSGGGSLNVASAAAVLLYALTTVR